MNKSFITRSWKTTACGFLLAAGQFLVLAPVAQLRFVGAWVNGDNRHAYMVSGVVLACLACLLLGIASRDHNVSSEDARR